MFCDCLVETWGSDHTLQKDLPKTHNNVRLQTEMDINGYSRRIKTRLCGYGSEIFQPLHNH